jgi:elongation factor G
VFKLEESKFGQLTFIRVYQGKLKKGEFVWNDKIGKKLKVSRMVKMHANQMEEIAEVKAGDIFAIFGVECSTGETLTEGDMSNIIKCQSMFVPEAVMSLTVKPAKPDGAAKFQKALSKFQREDPTFKVNVDKESEEIIISGMGELHLQIYVERMKREFGIDVMVGHPGVNYRETITKKANFDYLHKKQTGGAGQYARVVGYI